MALTCIRPAKCCSSSFRLPDPTITRTVSSGRLAAALTRHSKFFSGARRPTYRTTFLPRSAYSSCKERLTGSASRHCILKACSSLTMGKKMPFP